MKLVQKICKFFHWIFSYFTEESFDDEPVETSSENSMEDSEEEMEVTQEEEKINVAKRTLMTELYILEQEITVFENTFPEEYKSFMERIELLREKYNASLEELQKLLTFEIDPEIDSSKIGEVSRLKMDIKKFIEKEVKFDMIEKRLQRLIVGLNVLYNSSISYFKEFEKEKEKISSQLEQVLEVTTNIAREFKECDYILNDNLLKERIISLISYVDYEVFKTSVRNFNETPDELIKKLVMITEFDGFDYAATFKAFAKDELTDLGPMLSLIADQRFCQALRKKLQELLINLSCSDDAENQILNIDFWHNFLALESNLFEMLKISGVEEEKIKIGLIIRMDIKVDKSEIFVSPKTTAYLALTNLYSTTRDKKLLLLIKLLKDITDDVTYKEIYFLVLIFDVLEVLVNNSNELIRHIEKYIKKYAYDEESMAEKKNLLMGSSNKSYVVVFTLNQYDEDIITTLRNLNIDFRVNGDKVLINSFYFNELENVLTSLRANTKNIMI